MNLPQLNCKTIVTPNCQNILNMPPELQRKLFADLRKCYDGPSIVKASYGSLSIPPKYHSQLLKFIDEGNPVMSTQELLKDQPTNGETTQGGPCCAAPEPKPPVQIKTRKERIDEARWKINAVLHGFMETANFVGQVVGVLMRMASDDRATTYAYLPVHLQIISLYVRCKEYWNGLDKHGMEIRLLQSGRGTRRSSPLAELLGKRNPQTAEVWAIEFTWKVGETAHHLKIASHAPDGEEYGSLQSAVVSGHGIYIEQSRDIVQDLSDAKDAAERLIDAEMCIEAAHASVADDMSFWHSSDVVKALTGLHENVYAKDEED